MLFRRRRPAALARAAHGRHARPRLGSLELGKSFCAHGSTLSRARFLATEKLRLWRVRGGNFLDERAHEQLL